MNNSPIETPRQPKKGGIPFTAIIAIVVILALGMLWKSRSGGKGAAAENAPKRDNTPSVRVMTASTGTLVTQLDVTGTMRANQNVDLNAKIAGRVAAVPVKEGDRVRRGQVVVQLEQEDFITALNQANANLRAAQVKLDQTKVGLPARIAQVNTSIEQAQADLSTKQAQFRQAQANEPAQITQARSQVDVAQAGVRSAAAQVNQARTTAKQTAEQTEAAIKTAQGALAQAQAQLEQTKNGSREQEINRAQAQVNLAEAQLKDAQTNLTRQQTLFAGGATAKANVDTAQTAFEVAKANLDSAKQELSLVKAGSRTEEVRAAEEVVRQRESALTQAIAGRGEILRAQSAVTSALAAQSQAQEQLRQATANLAQIPVTREQTKVAREAVSQSKASLDQALANRTNIPVYKQDVNAAEAAVQQAQAQVEQAQLNLNSTTIVSPVNGVVTAKLTDVGESASLGTSLMTLVALDNTYFEAQIPESQLAQVQVNQPAQVYVTAASPKPFDGYVSEIIRVADQNLRQFRIRITIPNGDKLTPGAFARGTIRTNVIKGAVIVPDELIHTDNDKDYVLEVKEDPGKELATVIHQPVVVGPTQDGKTQIINGVQPGDKIITGSALFEDKAKVRVAKPGKSGGGAPGEGGASREGSPDSGGKSPDSGTPPSGGSTSSH